MMKKIGGSLFLILWLYSNLSFASATIQLTLDKVVDIAINNSYRTKLLQFDIRRSLHWLRARQASLKTQIYMNLQTPEINNLSEYKWNSTLGKDEIVRQNTQRWQGDMSVKYPIILFGYPTNGYLSLNYKVYRYLQKDHGNDLSDYYNRLYLKFEQPFLLPNELRNDLKEAELNLKYLKFEYMSERMEIIEDISDDYYDIFELTYYEEIYRNKLRYLDELKQIILNEMDDGNNREMDLEQIELETSNTLERLWSNRSSLREQTVRLKQRLRLNPDDSLYVIPEIHISPVIVDLDQAIRYGFENSPRLKRLKIDKKQAKLDVENERGENAFHLKLEMTYGLEKGNHRFDNLWDNFDNSNSVTLNAYIPIVDGGERRERIQAELLNVSKRDLQIKEEKEDIRNDISNAYKNMNEYYRRSEKMRQNLLLAMQITETSIGKFKNYQISLQDLLQIIEKTKETEENFIDIYLGYRFSLLDLMTETYYDFEKNISLGEEIEIE
ncbi:hypothetical protein GF337_05500 [candidate division KSB1 bacterium]|nr:hypothetical protein [candidate division KSB1 bacterium]